MEPASPLSVAALERQLREGPQRLRFAPTLEPLFLAEHALGIVPRRTALLIAALVLIGVTPALNAFVLHPPEAFMQPALLAQFGLMIPSILLALFVTRSPSLRRWQDPIAAVTAFAVTAGIMYQRYVGAMIGFAVPVELVGVVFLGTAVLAGLRIVWFAPLAGVIVVAFGWNEIVIFGASAAALNSLTALVMMAVLASIGAWMEERSARAAWLQRKLLEQLAVRDSLTGLANARAFHDHWPRLHAAAVRDGQPLLLAILDIDYFKSLNDHYGHAAGDECIRRVAGVLREHGRRATDLQARLGGDEFVLVWYGTGPGHAMATLDAVRAGVESLRMPNAGAPAGGGIVTLSIGAALLHAGCTPDQLMEIADRQLYLSKERGRNRVSLANVDANP